MSARRSEERLAEAARLYYVEGCTQHQVAGRMATTRSNVSRMLAAARDHGIVQFRITSPTSRQQRIEEALVERFPSLSRAVVLAADASGASLERVGRLGAIWLGEQLRDGMTVAVSWGRTLQALVRQVEADRAYDVDVVQIGGDLQLDPRLSGHELIRDLAARLGGRHTYLHAPAILDSPETVERLLANRNISDQLQLAREADLALIGIGGFGQGFAEQLLESAHLTAAERDAFAESEPAGDVCARFFDTSGAAIDNPLRDRVLALDLDELRRIPRVVGVAAGREKGRAVWGALRGGWLDVLITDQAAAAAALHLERERTS